LPASGTGSIDAMRFPPARRDAGGAAADFRRGRKSRGRRERPGSSPHRHRTKLIRVRYPGGRGRL